MEYLYSVPVGDKRPGESHVYRNPSSVKGLLQSPANLSTMQSIWHCSVDKNGKHPCLENYTYHEIDEMASFVGSWLLENGFNLLYIHSINRWEWTLLDIACFKYGIVSVPLYDTLLGGQALDHTLGLT